MKKILFVCLGNICRSPAAEAVLNSMIEKHSADDQIQCDSAGTSGYHHGAPADSRMISHGEKRGYELLSRSRPFDASKDFDNFDWIITMDESNFHNVCAVARNQADTKKVTKFTDFCIHHPDSEVPDPYYGGAAGFEHVFDLLEDGCENLFQQINTRNETDSMGLP